MVKRSEKAGHISFSQSGCESWADLPTAMVEHAEYLSHTGCLDHSHPMLKITLTEPKTDEGRVLFALLASSSPRPVSFREGPGGGPLGFPPTHISHMIRGGGGGVGAGGLIRLVASVQRFQPARMSLAKSHAAALYPVTRRRCAQVGCIVARGPTAQKDACNPTRVDCRSSRGTAANPG